MTFDLSGKRQLDQGDLKGASPEAGRPRQGVEINGSGPQGLQDARPVVFSKGQGRLDRSRRSGSSGLLRRQRCPGAILVAA